MSFVRSGPHIVIVEPVDPNSFINYLKLHFDGRRVEDNTLKFNEIVSELQSDQTLIYITDSGVENIVKIDVTNCIIIDVSPQAIMMSLINMKMCDMIRFIRKSPRTVFMKLIGDPEQTIREISVDFEGIIEFTNSVFNNHSEGTIILFTKGNIHKRLRESELYNEAVYTTKMFSEVINTLDHHSLKYVNRNVKEDLWVELIIKIQDDGEAYKTQYERLMMVLDQLDVGIVLKESWGEEGIKIFSSCEVYELTLFTYLKPLEVKKILFALEFLENGERIVNYDLYQKRKKIHWDDLKEAGITDQSKLSAHYRQLLYEGLDQDDIHRLIGYDDFLFASR